MKALVNVVLLMALVVLIALNVFLRVDPSRRHLELFPQMAHSVPYDTYAENPNFADGKTLRPLPAGTIVRGAMPLHFKATPADAQRAAIELVSSVKAGDAKAIARGQWVFAQYCQTCHGPAGKGDGIVATRGFPMPASLIAPRALQMRDGQMFHVITYGQGNMPSHAAQVAREDRWNVIAYVRTLQAAATPSINATSVSSRAALSPLPASGERVRERGDPREESDRTANAKSTSSRAASSPLPASGERVRERGGSRENPVEDITTTDTQRVIPSRRSDPALAGERRTVEEPAPAKTVVNASKRSEVNPS